MALVPISRDATVSCISLQDSAIDWERSQPAADDAVARAQASGRTIPRIAYQVEQFRRPGSWRDSVAIKDGAQPTEFVLGVIPPSVLSRIEDECRLGKPEERTRELCWRSFLAGVRELRNGPTTEVIGSDGIKKQGTPKKVIDGIEYVDPEWLAKVFVGHLRDVAIDIGFICWGWQQLPPDDAKN